MIVDALLALIAAMLAVIGFMARHYFLRVERHVARIDYFANQLFAYGLVVRRLWAEMFPEQPFPDALRLVEPGPAKGDAA